MKTSLIALAAAVAVAMAPFDTADAARPQPKKTPPSSYAPSKSGKRVYGAPIQAPIVGKSSGRSERARAEFRRQEPCPSTGLTSGDCPGYRIGYIRPLSQGGQNVASNMQWEPVEVTASGR